MQFILMAVPTYERNECRTFTYISVPITLNCFESLPRGCNANCNENSAHMRAQPDWQRNFNQFVIFFSTVCSNKQSKENRETFSYPLGISRERVRICLWGGGGKHVAYGLLLAQ
jgi:hypothetical protein